MKLNIRNTPLLLAAVAASWSPLDPLSKLPTYRRRRSPRPKWEIGARDPGCNVQGPLFRATRGQERRRGLGTRKQQRKDRKKLLKQRMEKQ